MGGSRGSQGIQYGRGHTSSITTCSMFATRRDQLYQSWNEGLLSSLYQALLICEMAYLSTSRSTQVACMAVFKKIDRETRKRGYESQIEGPYPSEKYKVQEDIFRAMTNLMFKWVWQKHPIIIRVNTYNYILSHLYKVRGFQYLRYLCADQLRWYKCTSICYI